ncbi:diguanylate cyclase [Halioglobus maricola]|uniref:diguanylate cyclase n=1 Tax=Halioglobus maricola TaxID=2601894 RepID=A0A5P9NGU5_9GAMM|nr:diguanylate cyclase [Halioglobus maricola]QFU75011.1 diguanylate cyclase [Halioglobus maricola]
MADKNGTGRLHREEIQGAPPATSRAELRERRISETVPLNRYLYQQCQQFEHMLLDAPDLTSLLEVLIFSFPRHFSYRVAELWLLDPEGSLDELIAGGERFGHYLQIHHDAFALQELYDLEPDVELIDATDSRMFEVLKSEHGIDYALMMPLMESGRLIGSLHLGIQEEGLSFGEAEEDLIAHIAAIVSRSYRTGVQRQHVESLIRLDPLTRVANALGFQQDLSREISRARRNNQPITVLLMEIDEYAELHDHYGEERSQFVLKRVAQRISSDLRLTDMMARLEHSRLAVLLCGCGEALGQDIAERMRQDIEDFAIDDGRGAVLQVTISVGLVSWEPQHYPAVDMKQLARQIESVGEKALESARAMGGNNTNISRLSTLIV